MYSWSNSGVLQIINFDGRKQGRVTETSRHKSPSASSLSVEMTVSYSYTDVSSNAWSLFNAVTPPFTPILDKGLAGRETWYFTPLY
jgi:hypothetical protein